MIQNVFFDELYKIASQQVPSVMNIPLPYNFSVKDNFSYRKELREKMIENKIREMAHLLNPEKTKNYIEKEDIENNYISKRASENSKLFEIATEYRKLELTKNIYPDYIVQNVFEFLRAVSDSGYIVIKETEMYSFYQKFLNAKSQINDNKLLKLILLENELEFSH